MIGVGIIGLMKTKSEKARELRLKRLYGLNPGEYEKILAYQKGVCVICLKPAKEGKRLHVDHNHKSALTRGCLCWRDNTAIAKFNDDKDRLRRAAEYIENPPATIALGREVYGRTGRITNKRKRKKSKRRNK